MFSTLRYRAATVRESVPRSEPNFAPRFTYRNSTLGIELPVTLSLNDSREVRLVPKIDTGAESCIFQREHGEALGLEVEGASPKRFPTATGPFETDGHTVKLSFLDFLGWLDKLRFGLVRHDDSLYLSHYDD